MARASLVVIAVVAFGLALGASSASAQRRSKRPAASAPPPAAEPAPVPTPGVEPQTAVPADGTAPMTVTPAAGTAGGASPAAGAASSGAPGGPAAPTQAAAQPAEPAAEASEPAKPGDDRAARAEKEAALERELSEVMDTLVQARARAAVLGKALWKTRVSVKVDNEAGEDQVAVRIGLWLDGAPVWSGDGSALGDPERVLFTGFIAPGQHVLTYEVEQRARVDEKYRYTQRASHRFTALRERRTELRLVLDDDSDIAEDFADDEEGEYDVRARLQVRAISPDDE